MDTQLSKPEVNNCPSKATKKASRRAFIKIGIVASSLVVMRAYHYNLREEKSIGDSKVVKRVIPDKKTEHEQSNGFGGTSPARKKSSSLDSKNISDSQDKNRPGSLKVTELF